MPELGQNEDSVRRLVDVQREVEAIASELMNQRTSRANERQRFARRLNAVKSQLKTVELSLRGHSDA